jgi:hypothetical protein
LPLVPPPSPSVDGLHPPPFFRRDQHYPQITSANH